MTAAALRRRRARLTLLQEPVVDLGPAIQHEPISVVVRGVLERENRPDPDAPNRTVSGARRRDALRAMHKAGSIDQAQWQVAEQFRDDLARAGGARLEANETGIRVAMTPGRYGPSDAQIDALARARGAHQAMGLVAAGVVSWVIIGGGGVRDYEDCKRIKHGAGAALLKTALDRLAEFYTQVGGR